MSTSTINDPKGEAGSKKAPMWLLPPVALEQTAWVHKLGNDKYGPFNWRVTGVCATTYVSAIMRHLNAWRDGEDLDPESGISHIAHIATSCNILMDAAACGTLQDDRNKRPAALTREEAFQKMASLPLTNLFEEEGRQMHPGMAKYIEIDESPWIDLIDKTSDFSGVVEVPRPDQIEVGGKLVDLPPVPEGYSRWVDRGMGWGENRSARYGYYNGFSWNVYEEQDISVPCGSRYHYIEAVKDAAMRVVDHDLVVGEAVLVKPVHGLYDFTTQIENLVDIRGEKVYTFSNGSKYTESEIHSITRIDA